MLEDQVGKVYGKLTVLAEAERQTKKRRVLVRCTCQAATEKTVCLADLRSGDTKSCGCLKKTVLETINSTHGLRQHHLYNTWQNMRARCSNPQRLGYDDYGGRGISVCERWQKFENFHSDMAPSYKDGLTLDRKDNDQGYSPENCRWATKAEQSRNKRSTINVTMNGRTQCLKDWCKELNLNYLTVYTRIRSGKTPEQALSYASQHGSAKERREFLKPFNNCEKQQIQQLKKGI